MQPNTKASEDATKPVSRTTVSKKWPRPFTMTTEVGSPSAKITLTNWETNRFCNQLSAKLRIPRNRAFFAGTKDKRAVTSQLFVIDAPMNKVADVELPDVEIEVLGRTHQKIGFGNHRGNRFTIVVRGCCHPDGTPDDRR